MVPIAIPLIAGPSALATLSLMSEAHGVPRRAALECLMGMLLLMLSVQMFIDGIRSRAFQGKAFFIFGAHAGNRSREVELQ